MSSNRETFEFYILRDKNWNVQDIYKSESDVMRVAQQALKSSLTEGVRVVRLWLRADGEQTEKVVFEKLNAVKAVRDVRITPINEAPYCETVEALLAPEGMRTVGLLFRKYLDEKQITPLELMHIHRQYTRLRDTENILASGVDRVALVQTRDTDMDLKTRTDEIYRMVENVGGMAHRFATDKFVPKRIKTTMSALLADAAENYYEPTYQAFYVNVVLCRDLMEQGKLTAKLARIAALLENETNPEAIAYLDAAAAQCFASPQVFQDALGPKVNLADALLSLIEILEGGDQAFDPMLPSGDLYLRLLQAGQLPVLRHELFERMVSMVAGTNPMSRNEPNNESTAFGRVANRLIDDKHVIGGEVMAEALADRACKFVVQGGLTGRKNALEWVLRVLHDVPQRVTVLRTLDHAFKAEPDMRLAAFGFLRSLICSATTADDFAPKANGGHNGTVRAKANGHRNGKANGSRDLVEPMRRVTDLYSWLETEYPAKPIKPLLLHLDTLVADYIVKQEIIEKMDKPDLKIADRATMLLNFVLSGVLTRGKAMDMARERVQDLLKRPDFITEFVQEFDDPHEQEKRLREFHALLAQAGFSL